MKKAKKSILQFFVIVLFFFLVNVYYIAEISNKKKQVLACENKCYQITSKQKDSFLRELEINSTFNSTYINPIDLYEANVCNSFILAYFYSGSECEKCVIDDIEKIKNKVNSKYPQNTFIFPIYDDSNSRSTRIKLSTELLDLNFRCLNKKDVILPTFEGKQIRFFCVISPEYELLNPYFPDINMAEKTNMYLEFFISTYLE